MRFHDDFYEPIMRPIDDQRIPETPFPIIPLEPEPDVVVSPDGTKSSAIIFPDRVEIHVEEPKPVVALPVKSLLLDDNGEPIVPEDEDEEDDGDDEHDGEHNDGFSEFYERGLAIDHEIAPYGYTKDGKPRKKPGRKSKDT